LIIALLTSPDVFREDYDVAILFSNVIIPDLCSKYKYALCVGTRKV